MHFLKVKDVLPEQSSLYVILVGTDGQETTVNYLEGAADISLREKCAMLFTAILEEEFSVVKGSVVEDVFQQMKDILSPCDALRPFERRHGNALTRKAHRLIAELAAKCFLEQRLATDTERKDCMTAVQELSAAAMLIFWQMDSLAKNEGFVQCSSYENSLVFPETFLVTDSEGCLWVVPKKDVDPATEQMRTERAVRVGKNEDEVVKMLTTGIEAKEEDAVNWESLSGFIMYRLPYEGFVPEDHGIRRIKR